MRAGPYLSTPMQWVDFVAACILSALFGACTDEAGSAAARDASPAESGGAPGDGGAVGTGGRSPALDSGGRQAPSFRKIVLTTSFYAEGASYGDFDRNGKTDVVSGPYWYEGPDFVTKHAIYTPVVFDPKSYSDNFLEFVRDFDADGYPDVLVVNYPGRDASVYANSKMPDVPWTRHQVVPSVNGESPAFTDLTGDGVPELVFAAGNHFGWAGPASATPFQPWTFHAASATGSYGPFTHGLGVGDVDGDGRLDILEATGAWIQPAMLTGAPVWSKLAAPFGSGGAQMFAYDVDGDGDSDVITSLAAHDYGIAWFEQQKSGTGATLVQHLFATNDPADAGASPVIHQPHALDFADVDGDGLPDVVTGERFWGHVPAGNPDPNAPAKLYWFSLERGASGAHFAPHLVDDASGVGTQVTAADVNDDGRIDIVVGCKKGAFVFLQEAN
jgi:FG-GAP-like repeat